MSNQRVRLATLIAFLFLIQISPMHLAFAAPDQPDLAEKMTVTGRKNAAPATGVDDVLNFKAINDPIEPYNRSMYAFDDMIVNTIIDPLATGWRAITPEPVRVSIRKAGLNLAYPMRLFNTLLQGKGKGALSETGRFLINTTVGLLGFFDPASRMGLKAYNEDFGQTLGYWGYGPGFYFVLPFVGPSTGRDTIGWMVDLVTNPATFVTGLGTFFSFNQFSFTLPGYEQLRTQERDPYMIIRMMTALKRKKDVEDYVIKVDSIDPDPTLESIYIRPRDKDFTRKALQFVAPIGNGRKVPYSLWMQPYPAPLVFIVGGTGNHRMSNSTVAMAELIFNERFSVVSISSAMNWEFMENAGSTVMPGYIPVDTRDVYAALESIDKDLTRRFRGQFANTRALMGISMGGIHTLAISSLAERLPASRLHFDRYVAIDTPTDLVAALEKLDEYFTAPLDWPEGERQARIEDCLKKAVALSDADDVDPTAELPFNQIESRYMIGLFFKMVLRDVIYSSQKRHDLGVLQSGFNSLSRDDAYDEIARYSFTDYMEKFLIPWYLQQSGLRITRGELMRHSNLRDFQESLATNQKVRAFINEQDIFLRPEDFEWYRQTLGNRLTVLPKGGHMGNLYHPEVQKKILETINAIKDIPKQ